MKKNKDNIMVFTRRVTSSNFKELKCKTTVKSSLSSIVTILTDVEHFTDWVYKCVVAVRLKQVTGAKIYSYQLFDAPWPIEDRDVVAEVNVTQDKKTNVVTVVSFLADHFVPEKKGVVRIKNFHTKYILTPKGNGMVEIDYELGTEPGGNIPAWLANLVIVNGPFETQQKMNELLQTSAIKSAKQSFIAEP